MLIALEAITSPIVEAHIVMFHRYQRDPHQTDTITTRHIVDPVVLQRGSNRGTLLDLDTRIITVIVMS